MSERQQSSLLEWCTPRVRRQPVADVETTRALRASEAARLGVPWPHLPKRHVGRPGVLWHWTALIHDCLRQDRFEEVARLQDLSVPAWFQPGMRTLQEPYCFVLETHARRSRVARPEVDDELLPKEKRQKTHVERHIQLWS